MAFSSIGQRVKISNHCKILHSHVAKIALLNLFYCNIKLKIFKIVKIVLFLKVSLLRFDICKLFFRVNPVLIELFLYRSKGQKFELTTVKFSILTEPHNVSLGFGIIDQTFQFYHFIFANAETRTGFDTFDLNFGRGN